jgi:hypothetical protein
MEQKSDFWQCHCACHTNDRIQHNKSCCYLCKLCNQRVVAGMMNNHLSECPKNKFLPREEKDDYDKIANQLIKDLWYHKNPKSFQYSIGERILTIEEYYKELKDRTEIGESFVKDYKIGLEF